MQTVNEKRRRRKRKRKNSCFKKHHNIVDLNGKCWHFLYHNRIMPPIAASQDPLIYWRKAIFGHLGTESFLKTKTICFHSQDLCHERCNAVRQYPLGSFVLQDWRSWSFNCPSKHISILNRSIRIKNDCLIIVVYISKCSAQVFNALPLVKYTIFGHLINLPPAIISAVARSLKAKLSSHQIIHETL